MSTRLEAALAELAAAIRDEIAAETAPPTAPRTYSVERAAELIGIGRTFAYREVSAGRLRVIRRGRRILVPESAVRDYIEGSAG